MIIGITEVKPKNSAYKLNPAEFNLDLIDSYHLFSINIDSDKGRGMILYVHKTLGAKEVNMEINYEENIFVKIALNNNDALLLGLLYRSPSEIALSNNNSNLLNLITEPTQKNFSHILLMGDINYPNIDWETHSCKSDNIESDEYKFTQCVQDNYLYQHVTKPTRWRGSDTPHVLDLIFTNEENMVSDIEYLSPLGKSDHCVIQFQYNCYTKLKIDNRTKICYDRGNYEDFNKEILETSWEVLLKQGDHIDKNWEKFHEKLLEMEKRYIPVKKIKNID
ncbi:Hypothetical predicted protein [Mytilus galloprovincialis]|uniref:Endonuclease/exonuclease/phosphatase domain-containing protein n=1 Tax=Mytilus galloprovincialis TaxID=29158 RepID=A0A8B6C835_MYTGA|nr:Hypothetical predicted protein [Mytilus galloprovincialis]